MLLTALDNKEISEIELELTHINHLIECVIIVGITHVIICSI